MEDFRRQFLNETVETLENLRHVLQSGEVVSAQTRRETFRILHTVKGTAQTFGFTKTSSLAHDLETLLSADGDAPNLLIEGIGLLQKSLTEQSFQIPEKFTENYRAAVPNAPTTSDSSDNLPQIPVEFYSQLSKREREMVNGAIRGGKNLAVLEVGFETVSFAAGLINFREILSAAGEIIATFPSAKFTNGNKIGFQFLTAGLKNARKLAVENAAEILWENAPEMSANNLEAVLRQIAQHGREVAAKFGKQIQIETSGGESELSPAGLKFVFETLLHLVRNAVDHAIERSGTIKINLKKETDGLRFSISDNGRGIDLEMIKTKALEKNLISAAENLTEAETLDLIFQPEFSTKTATTEISGRGIGLDAVKNAVEKSGGEISVKTEKGKGTTFEIFLPRT